MNMVTTISLSKQCLRRTIRGLFRGFGVELPAKAKNEPPPSEVCCTDGGRIAYKPLQKQRIQIR